MHSPEVFLSEDLLCGTGSPSSKPFQTSKTLEGVCTCDELFENGDGDGTGELTRRQMDVDCQRRDGLCEHDARSKSHFVRLVLPLQQLGRIDAGLEQSGSS
jgi:hypothetical protein